jgi:hypothetical protein
MMEATMAVVDQSGIIGKIRDQPIGATLEQLLKRAAEDTGIDRVYVTSGGQPGSHGQSTGSTRHNNGRAADLQLIAGGDILSFSDNSGGKVADFVTACASRGAIGIGAGVHYMGNKTIHVGFGTSPQDQTKIVWGANGASANAPQWLRMAAQSGWNSRVSDLMQISDSQFEGYSESVPEPGDNEPIPISNIEMSADARSGETTNFPRCDGMIDAGIFARVSRSTKPPIEYIASPYQFDRNGVDIDYLVLHYTTSRNIDGTISHFLDNEDQVAAHYVIGRDGRIVQMVKDKKKCYHGNSKNSRSIGIEHSAAPGDELTANQEASSLDLIRWLCAEYDIPVANIIPHKCAPRATSCPGDLFMRYGATGASSCEVHRDAVQKWLAEKL